MSNRDSAAPQPSTSDNVYGKEPDPGRAAAKAKALRRGQGATAETNERTSDAAAPGQYGRPAPGAAARVEPPPRPGRPALRGGPGREARRDALSQARPHRRDGLGHRHGRLPHRQEEAHRRRRRAADPSGGRPRHHLHGQLLGLQRGPQRTPHGRGTRPGWLSGQGLPHVQDGWPLEAGGGPADRHVAEAPAHGPHRPRAAP